MKIVRGFAEARLKLSRQAPTEFYSISPNLKKRLRDMFATENPEEAVKKIISDVRQRGDAALLDYSLRIDGVRLTSLEVSRQQVADAYNVVDENLIAALKLAAERIRAFHMAQKETIQGGSLPGLSQLVRPLNRVGSYVPGGTASYPSTVLMTAIPARVAGVKEVILSTPPQRNAALPPLTLVAADIAGVDGIFAIGGAQAIAAMAYGTETVPKVDKICGPGNIFVFLAKKLLYGTVGIDGLQGPSEVLIIADETADAEYCAADMLAQAEHDALAAATLVTSSEKLAEAVNEEIEKQLKALPRQSIAAESLANQGTIAIVASVDEAIELANLYAPEHLCLVVAQADSYIDKVRNAGCVFIGENSTEVLGDYVAGPSHTLPTSGTARFSSPLNVLDFVKLTSLINIGETELRQLGPAAALLAHAEGLDAHARSVEKRLARREHND